MKIVTAFFMAWGNFITLPCPYKKWDNDLKNLMLAFLPSIGLVIGALWCLVYMILCHFDCPAFLSAFVMVFYIFYVCGFMHMDGFMDCNDAIMSRRDLAERQRILKDSTVGAYAVVCVAFLLLGWFASMVSVFDKLDYGILLTVPVVSRAVSGLAVLYYKPIGHSQYVKDYQEPARWRYRLIVALQLAVILVIACMISVPAYVLPVAVFMALAGWGICFYARKQLGGMSGDVAGYTICAAEIAGIIFAAVIL